MRLLCCVFLFLPFFCWAGELGIGDNFPDFEMKAGLSRQDYSYLGLSPAFLFSKRSINLNNIKAHLLFVEFLNRYCIVCQKDAPEFARFFHEIEADPDLKEKVKILGVAIGNSIREVDNFRKEYYISFPIFSDADTEIYRRIGSPGGSPLVYILKKYGSQWVIVDGFKGETRHSDMLMRVRIDMALDVRNLKRGPLWTEEPIRKPADRDVRRLLSAKMPGIQVIRSILFDNGDLFIIKKGKETLFAKVEARKILCAVCHDASFIYVFDRKGTIREFIPIYLTKTDNRPFSINDTERIRKSLIGRNILMPFKFDKDVDAVTSATLTSFVIFDSVHHGQELLKIVEGER